MAAGNVIPKELKKTLAVQVMSLRLLNTPVEEVAKQLNLSVQNVKSLMTSDDGKQALEEIEKEALRYAKSYLRKNTSQLVPEAIDALRRALKKDQVEGIKLVFRVAGVLDEDKDSAQNQGITIVMPDTREPAIEVKNGAKK